MTRHIPLRIAGRFVAGHHLDGRKRSDASWLRAGTAGELSPLTGRETWWTLLPGWKRAAIRLTLVAVLVGLWRWRRGTEWVLALTCGPALGLAAWRCVAAARAWRHRRTLERPTALALSPFLGVAPREVEAALGVRPNPEDAGGGEHLGSLELPDHWAATSDQRARVEEVIGARLGVDARWQWRTADYPMLLNFTRAPTPPTAVPLAEVRAELAARPASKILLGRSADGTLHWWDRSAEDPHVAVHGGSQRGKTRLLLSLAAQEVERGGHATLIDPKWVGLADLAGVPGITLLRDPRDIHAMWDGVRAWRQVAEDRFADLTSDPTLEFPYELLIVDEVSLFSAITQRTWRGEKDRSEPALAPVWDDLAAGVWTGAQVRVHAVVAGQRLDYAILGGMLGSFGARLLAGYLPQDYARLVGVPPFIRSQKPRGRFLLYDGGDPTWLQLVHGEPAEWRDYAMEALRPASVGSDLGAARPGETGDSGELVGLADAAAHLGMTDFAFRKARQRRPVEGETRTPDGRPAWTPEMLDRWRGRPAAAAGAEPGVPGGTA